MDDMQGVPRSVRSGTRWTLPAALLLVMVVYWFERAQNPGWGDGMSFLVTALNGFSWSVNATGHFLYTNLNTLILRFASAADPVSLLTAASVLFALLALVQVYRTAMIITGNAVASLAGMLIMAFSFTFWRQAISIEVYSMHLALVAAFLRYVTSGMLDGKRFYPDRVGIFLGLALLVHIQTVLLLPALAVWGIFAGWKRQGLPRSLAWITLAFFLLLVPAMALPGLTVASVFVDFRFADNVFAFSPGILVAGCLKSIAYLVYNFHLFLPVIALGAVRLHRRQRHLFILYTSIVVPVWGFAFRYTISDSYVFFIPAYLVLALMAASGFAVLMEARGTRRWSPAVVLAAAFVLSPAVYRISLLTAERLPCAREAFSPVRYKGGVAYYLWPGMRTIPDPLAVVKEQYPGGDVPPGMDSAAWENLYPKAVSYLQLTGKLPNAANRVPARASTGR